MIRAFLAAHGDQRVVRTVVTLGTPHAGSKVAAFAVGEVRKDLLPGSPFLTTLNAEGVRAPRDGRLFSIHSILDSMVLPYDSAIARGEGVTSLEIGPVNHVGLLFSRRIAAVVRRCLEQKVCLDEGEIGLL